MAPNIAAPSGFQYNFLHIQHRILFFSVYAFKTIYIPSESYIMVIQYGRREWLSIMFAAITAVYFIVEWYSWYTETCFEVN